MKWRQVSRVSTLEVDLLWQATVAPPALLTPGSAFSNVSQRAARGGTPGPQTKIPQPATELHSELIWAVRLAWIFCGPCPKWTWECFVNWLIFIYGINRWPHKQSQLHVFKIISSTAVTEHRALFVRDAEMKTSLVEHLSWMESSSSLSVCQLWVWVSGSYRFVFGI